MVAEYLLYYLFLLIILIIVNVAGKVVLATLNIKPVKKFYRIFLELVFGVTMLVFLYSVFKTGFMTVNILFIFLFLYYFFVFDSRKINFPWKNNWLVTFRNIHKDILLLALCCLPFFLFELYYLYSSSGFIVPHADYFLYSELSDSLNYSGRENLFFSSNILFPDQFKGMQPYHYFELWLNAFISKIFHSPSIYSLILITYPCLSCIVYLGFIALWESYYKVSFLTFSAIFFLFFSDGVFFPFYNNISFLSDNHSTLGSSLFTIFGAKFSSSYMFIVLFLLLFIKDKKAAAFIALSSLLIISVGLMPGIGIGTYIYLLLNRFHHTFSPKNNRKLLVFYAILSVLFYCVYFVLGYSSKSTGYVSGNNFVQTMLSDITNINHYKYMFGMMLYRFMVYIIFYFPYILLAFVISKTLIKNNKDLFKLIILVLLCNCAGIFSFGFAIGLTNSGQLFTNTFVFSTSLLITIFIFGLTKFIQLKCVSKNYLYAVSFAAIFVLNSVNIYNNDKIFNCNFIERYSKNYINNIITETKDIPLILCAALYSEQEYKQIDYEWFSYIEPGHACQLTYGYRDIININVSTLFDNMMNMSNTDMYLIQNSTFYLFTKNQKELGLFKTYEQSQLDFIDEYKIRYMFANKDAEMSEVLKKRVVKEIIDEKSGERFYILNN